MASRAFRRDGRDEQPARRQRLVFLFLRVEDRVAHGQHAGRRRRGAVLHACERRAGGHIADGVLVGQHLDRDSGHLVHGDDVEPLDSLQVLFDRCDALGVVDPGCDTGLQLRQSGHLALAQRGRHFGELAGQLAALGQNRFELSLLGFAAFKSG